jgi:Tfp pilus assembly protein PilF
MNLQTKTLVQQAQTAYRAKQPEKAAALYKRALKIAPRDEDLRIKYASIHLSMGKIEEATRLFHDFHIEHPDNSAAWAGCAVAYLQKGEFEMAEKFLMKLVSKDPQDYTSWTNLCFAAGSSGRHSDSLFYAMQAMQIKPLESRSHNNLGTALLSVGRLDDALIAFDTALTLDPSNLDSYSNVATVYSFKGEAEKAIAQYKACLDRIEDKNGEFAAGLRYRMSFDYFRLGDLKSGWENYEFGFQPKDVRSRNPKRKFKQPKWQGQPLEKETLLIWKEQGLGDELNFLSALKDARAICKNIIVECDYRLVKPLARSFPDITFRPVIYDEGTMFPLHDDFDFHIPIGSVMAMYRKSLEDFKKGGPYMKPDPERQAIFKERLEKLDGKINIGISWRSGTLSPERNMFYTSLSDWEPILKLKDVNFINVQYADAKQEIADVENFWGIKIHQWDDLDLRDDLDGVFTLMSCMDHVVTVDTSVSGMVKVVGTPCSILTPHHSQGLYGQGRYVTYPNVDTYINEGDQPLKEVLPKIAEALAARYQLECRP